MRIVEVENPRPYIIKHIEPLANAKKRMQELGIGEAYPHLMRWIYTGLFRANPETMDKFANVFYAIRGVLPPEVIATYKTLPTLYRGMVLKNDTQIDKIKNGGLEIKSQIAAWTPDKQRAASYAHQDYYKDGKLVNIPGILLKHNPTEKNVVLALNESTLKYLGIGSDLPANPNEVILSLPILKITPDMVEKVFDKP